MDEILIGRAGIKIPMNSAYTIGYNEEINHYIITMPNARLRYFPNFFSEIEANRTLSYFMEKEKNGKIKPSGEHLETRSEDWKNIPWRQDAILMYGKKVLQPRMTAWFADDGKNYKYSGLQMTSNAWNEALLAIKNKIEHLSDMKFNSVLMNAYRNGHDHMGWHADDEPELGRNPQIASVNFGAQRRFLLRRNANHSEKVEMLLQPGSLLLMEGELQHYWKHAIPKQLKVSELRVNLTFRHIF